MGSVVAPGFFLSMFLWDRPFLSRRKDSLSDFFSDFLLDIGLSSALAMSETRNGYTNNEKGVKRMASFSLFKAKRAKSTLSVERALCKYDGGLSAVEDDQPVRRPGRQEAPLRTRSDRVDAGGR